MLRIVLLLCLFSRLRTCPNPFISVGSFCFHKSSSSFTYCQAQDYCHRLGGELVAGNANLKTAQTHFTGYAWIGLNDFTSERKSARNGWQWSDGTLVNESHFSWDAAEPGSQPNQDCGAMDSNNELQDKYCSKMYKALCQLRSQKTPCAEFSGEAALSFSDTEKFAKDPCVQSYSGVTNPAICASNCYSVPYAACKVFFFSDVAAECHLVLYNDASLALSGPKWRKFVRGMNF